MQLDTDLCNGITELSPQPNESFDSINQNTNSKVSKWKQHEHSKWKTKIEDEDKKKVKSMWILK